MNSEPKSSQNCAGKMAYAIAILGAILIVVFINHQLKQYTKAPPVDEGRAEERAKALAEIRNAEADALDHTGWIDPTKGVVRLRINDAMDLMVQTWGANPAAGRSNLLERVAKANPPPPPPAPKPKSEFE
jgi:hypothetical protein